MKPTNGRLILRLTSLAPERFDEALMLEKSLPGKPEARRRTLLDR